MAAESLNQSRAASRRQGLASLQAPKLILVVEDERDLRLLYAEELEEEGYRVSLAGDGHGLLERIAREKPDLVVLDIVLGHGNGLDLLEQIRNRHYDLPVILCSAYELYRGHPKAIAADYYVVKSWNLDELKKKIRMALESRSQIAALATPPPDRWVEAPALE